MQPNSCIAIVGALCLKLSVYASKLAISFGFRNRSLESKAQTWQEKGQVFTLT